MLKIVPCQYLPPRLIIAAMWAYRAQKGRVSDKCQGSDFDIIKDSPVFVCFDPELVTYPEGYVCLIRNYGACKDYHTNIADNNLDVNELNYPILADRLSCWSIDFPYNIVKWRLSYVIQ